MLFTFVTDYQGGTYITQVEANGLPSAQKKAEPRIEAAIEAQFDEYGLDNPVSVDGVVGVWCTGTLDQDENGVLVNIILTDGTTLKDQR